MSSGLWLLPGPTPQPLLAFKHAAPHLPPISRSAIPEDTPRPPPGSSSTQPGHGPPSSLSPASPGPAPPHAQAAPPLGEPSASVSTGTSPELRPEAYSPGVPLAQAPWEAATFYNRDTPSRARPGLPARLPEGGALRLGRPLRDRKETSGTGILGPGTWKLARDEEWGTTRGGVESHTLLNPKALEPQRRSRGIFLPPGVSSSLAKRGKL